VTVRHDTLSSYGRFPLMLGFLQVLCLNVGTDILPVVAVGAEPSNPRALSQPPQGRHLEDWFLLFRAFIVLGLTESIVEMLAFLAALSYAGWRPGLPFPSGTAFLSASGAAFTAVVAGQMANAFACRSASLWPGRLGWFSNRYLIIAVLCEAAMLTGFLYFHSLAKLLGQAPPNIVGYLTGLLAIPAVFAADAIHKQYKRRKGAGSRDQQ
jgi:magnesium-transporting ATPase (P-type)